MWIAAIIDQIVVDKKYLDRLAWVVLRQQSYDVENFLTNYIDQFYIKNKMNVVNITWIIRGKNIEYLLRKN